MKVKEVMTANPRIVTAETTVAEAAALMLDADCGLLPVVADGRLAGVVTDRDMYIALATRNRLASELTVGEVAQRPVHTCEPDDDVAAALKTMEQYHVRRLPVEGFAGTVLGVVSIDDVVRHAGIQGGIRDEDALRTLQSIFAQHKPVPHVVMA